ncbi:MAG: hypothetical protein WCT11_00550 [Candidatus Magasanikbacteria bacterium]
MNERERKMIEGLVDRVLARSQKRIADLKELLHLRDDNARLKSKLAMVEGRLRDIEVSCLDNYTFLLVAIIASKGEIESKILGEANQKLRHVLADLSVDQNTKSAYMLDALNRRGLVPNTTPK